MRKTGLVYIIVVLILLVGVFLFLLNEEQKDTIKQNEFYNSQINESVVIGSDIIKEYHQHKSDITSGTYIINVKDKNRNAIKYNDDSDFEYMIYKFQKYDREEIIYNGITTVNFSIESYSNLISTITKNNNYDKEKLKLYYIDDYTSSKPSVGKVRNLGENEVYGKDVIGNYKSHQAQIESEQVYFKVVDGYEKSYLMLNELEKDINDNGIYKKEFELTSNGLLKGYKFIKVNE